MLFLKNLEGNFQTWVYFEISFRLTFDETSLITLKRVKCELNAREWHSNNNVAKKIEDARVYNGQLCFHVPIHVTLEPFDNLIYERLDFFRVKPFHRVFHIAIRQQFCHIDLRFSLKLFKFLQYYVRCQQL